ncbi:MAG TPA: hypothetical protein VGM16_06900 [Gammaproteobacteria bacterium]|jgi:hypothetical protein
MKKWLGLALFFYSGFCMAALQGKQDAYAMLLLSPSADDASTGGIALQQDTPKDPAMLDLAAERLCIFVYRDKDVDTDDNPGAVTEISKALAMSGDVKYKNLVLQAWQVSKDDDTRKDLTKVLALFSKAPAPDYTPDCPSLEELRAKTFPGRTPSMPDRKLLLGLEEGTSLDQLYQRVGTPSLVKKFIHVKVNPFMIFHPVHADREMVLYYGFAGGVHLLYDGSEWKLSRVVIPATDLTIMPKVDPSAEHRALIENILSPDSDDFSQAADQIEDGKIFSTDVLDVVATRIWMERNAGADEYEMNATVDLCESLGASGNPRYHTLLETVAKAAPNYKIHRAATKALDKLPETAAEQFPVPAASP